MHTCAHNHGRLATEICHYTSDRLPPPFHAPIFLPQDGICRCAKARGNARGLQQQRGRCAAARSTSRRQQRDVQQQQCSAEEETPTGARTRSSSATAAAAPALRRPRTARGSPGTARNTGQPFNLAPSSSPHPPLPCLQAPWRRGLDQEVVQFLSEHKSSWLLKMQFSPCILVACDSVLILHKHRFVFQATE